MRFAESILNLSGPTQAGVFQQLRARSMTGARVVAALAIASLGLVAQPAEAAEGAVCQSISFGDYKLLNPDSPRSHTVAIAIPAGQVSIPTASSWDAYPDRVNMTQSSERWAVEFIGASGQVVGTSGSTGDLADRVVEAHWNGSLGTVTLSAPAVSVRAVHRPDSSSINSVTVSGISVCYTPVPPTTVATVTTTTTPVEVGSTPTTVATTTVTSSPETTIPATTRATVRPTTSAVPLTTSESPALTEPTTSAPSTTESVPTTSATLVTASTAPPPSGPTISEPTKVETDSGDPDAVVKTGGLAVTGVELSALLALGLFLLGGGMFLLLSRRAAGIAQEA